LSRSLKVFTFAFLLVSSLMVCGAFAQKPSSTAAAEKIVAIRAARLIDGVSAQPRHNVLIVIRGNRIESVTDGGTPPANATVIDLPAQATVLPD